MKTPKLLALSFIALLLTSPLSVLAAPSYWASTISTPASVQNKRSFNIEFTTLSTNASDTFNVELFQNGSSIGSQTTSAGNGDSGAFLVTVPADGVYTYYTTTTNIGVGEPKNSATKQVKVDATAPASPIYQGKVRSGNMYAITFTAPATADVTEVRVFSAPTTTFTANAATQVSSVAVTPGQQVTINYSASDDRERFHAVQAFDSVGNGSATVGDPNVVAVVPVAADGTQGATTIGTAAAQTGTDAAVAGAQNQAPGQVQADGSSTTDSADVLGAGDKAAQAASAGASNAARNIGLGVAGLIALLAALAFVFREKISSLIASRSK